MEFLNNHRSLSPLDLETIVVQLSALLRRLQYDITIDPAPGDSEYRSPIRALETAIGLLSRQRVKSNEGWMEGNAARDAAPNRSWLVGHFVEPTTGLRGTNLVELKWGTHSAGEEETEWTANRESTTISILIRGRNRIEFPDGTALLKHEGDYAIWAPRTPHRWHAEEDSIVITARWPSIEDDNYVVREID